MRHGKRDQLRLTAVRLPPDIVERIDALRPCFSTEWHEATRTDVLRALILTKLDELDQNPDRILEMWNASGMLGQASEALNAWITRKKAGLGGHKKG